MNFSTIQGYRTYAHFATKVREAVNQEPSSEKKEIEQNYDRSVFAEPIDKISISNTAQNASNSYLVERELSRILRMGLT